MISPGEPIGYMDPAKALSVLERMRKETGDHIKLFRVEPIMGPVMLRKDLEKYNADQGVKDFEYSMVSEYLE